MLYRRGFTIIEVLVVVALIGSLAGVMYMNFEASRVEVRDNQRQVDLRNMQTALDLYKLKHGRYPEGCNAANTWSGQRGSARACSDGRTDYIRGAVGREFSPEFIRTLPTDTRINTAGDGGYMYQTNADGTVYKLMAWRTVEGDTWLSDTGTVQHNDPSNRLGIATQRHLLHPFKSCDISPDSTAVCDAMSPQNNGGSTMPYCASTNAIYRTSYAVWGGRAIEPITTGARSEEQTERIVCDDPSNSSW